MHLTGNTILVTGGTSGIGRALAEQFHQRGNRVIIAGRRRKLIDEITNANPGMQGLALDLEQPGAIATFAADIAARFPALNVLVNNAGISKREDLLSESFDLSLSRSMIQTNILSVIQLTSALLPTLMRQPNSTVITTTSGLGMTPLALLPTYCATKAFLHSWLQSLRFQLRETKVGVLELVPPYVQTELGGPQQAVDPHAMPLADFIAEVMDLLGKGELPQDEIVVECAKELRFAEKSGAYEQIFAGMNNRW